MKELKIYYLEGCPYCRKAMTALEELKAENPEFDKVGIEWIEETRSPEIADKFDYYRVPSIFCGDEWSLGDEDRGPFRVAFGAEAGTPRFAWHLPPSPTNPLIPCIA